MFTYFLDPFPHTSNVIQHNAYHNSCEEFIITLKWVMTWKSPEKSVPWNQNDAVLRVELMHVLKAESKSFHTLES